MLPSHAAPLDSLLTRSKGGVTVREQDAATKKCGRAAERQGLGGEERSPIIEGAKNAAFGERATEMQK